MSNRFSLHCFAAHARRFFLIATAFAVVLPVHTAARAAGGDGDAQSRSARRERWERMTPDERQAARERFERFRALPPEERAELLARAGRLRDSRARMVDELAPDVRERLDQLEPEKRDAVLRDLARGNAYDLAQRIREALPQDWLAELEKATPEERARFLVEFKARQRGRMASFTIREIGERLGLAATEIERLQRLPTDERIAQGLELRKRLLGRDVRKLGLPKGISAEDWEAWQALPPEEFFRRMIEHSRAMREKLRAQPDVPMVDREGRAREEALWRIEEAVRTRPEEVIDLAELSPEERRERLFLAARARAVAALRAEDVMPREKIDELETMPPQMFFATMRRLLGPLHRPSCVTPRGDGERADGSREHGRSRR
ncbi:MAG: DUF3106 domain-containing protein [Planctomycetota bacterium]